MAINTSSCFLEETLNLSGTSTKVQTNPTRNLSTSITKLYPLVRPYSHFNVAFENPASAFGMQITIKTGESTP